MIPNDFGIIRQPGHDLLALLFGSSINFNDYDFEIVQPEYVDGYYYSETGGMQTQADYSCAVVDVSKYEKILIPSSTAGNNIRISLTNTPENPRMHNNIWVTSRCDVASRQINYYALFNGKPSGYNYAVVNTLMSCKFPIIGFIKKSS